MHLCNRTFWAGYLSAGLTTDVKNQLTTFPQRVLVIRERFSKGHPPDSIHSYWHIAEKTNTGKGFRSQWSLKRSHGGHLLQMKGGVAFDFSSVWRWDSCWLWIYQITAGFDNTILFDLLMSVLCSDSHRIESKVATARDGKASIGSAGTITYLFIGAPKLLNLHKW